MWLGAQREAPRALAEPELDQERSSLGAHHRLTVEALHAEARHATAAHLLGERLQSRPQPVLVNVHEREQALAAALEVERRLAVEHHDVCTRHARWPAAR